MNKKVYITRKLPDIAEEVLAKAGIEFDVNPEDRVLTKAELVSALEGGNYDAVLCLLTDTIDKEVFAAAPNTKIFSNYAVGFNNINLDDAKSAGVTITNTPGVLSQSVAEHTMALILALAKRIVEADRFTREGKYKGWGPLLMLGADLKGKTLGLVGAGRIGALVAEMAIKGFGMNVSYYDLKNNAEIEAVGAKFVSTLDGLLEISDFVSVHVPLLDSTKHLINAEKLSRMKPSAFLINTSRGPVVDEAALVAALKEGTIKGAALDVFENEPALAPGLAELPNIVLTPHTASGTVETRSKMAEMAATAIVDFLSGREPKNRVVQS